MPSLFLLLRALRWRAGATVALLAVATLAVLAAAIGPLYYTAVAGEVIRTTLADASASANGITAVPSPVNPASEATQVALLAGRDRMGRWYQAPIRTLDAGVTVPARPDNVAFLTDLVARTDVCAHLRFVAGRCPTAADQVAITRRSSLILRAPLGSRIVTQAHDHPGLITVTVVGIVRAGTARANYWMGDDFFDYARLPTSPEGIAQFLRRPGTGQKLPQLDAFFTVPATVATLPLNALVQLPLDQDRVGFGDTVQLIGAETAFAYTATTRYHASVHTDLVSELDGAGYQDGLMLAIVVLVGLQLVLLALVVLFGLVSHTSEARQRDVTLAKLHGLRRRTVLAVGLLEPTLVLLLALGLGLLLALGAARLISALVLGGAPVVVTPVAVLAALAAFGGGLAATLLGALRILRRRLSDELAGARPKSSATGRAIFDGAVVALALGAIVELRVSGVLSGVRPNPLAVFAPGLVAVAVGVVGARLVPIGCHRLLRRAREGQRVAAQLAIAQAVRRPANLRQIMVLALTAGIAFFAVVSWSVAASDRTQRADFEVGAARVIRVQVPAGVDLVAAVRRADPSGRYAMAVEESTNADQRLLAVDAARLARVGYWPTTNSSRSLAQLANWLQPQLGPAVVLRGSQARLTVDLPRPLDPEPDLQMSLLDPGDNATVVDFGYLRPGTHRYRAPLPPACAGGCRVTQLVPYWESDPGSPASVTYTLAISDLGSSAGPGQPWHREFGGFSRAGYWHQASSGARAVSASGGVLRARFTDSQADVTSPALEPGALPPTLPGVGTDSSHPGDPASVPGQDFDGTEIDLDLTREAVALPQLGGRGVMIDLPVALRAEQGAPFDTTDEVWLAPGAPTRIVERLRADGLQVTGVETPGPLVRRLDHEGLAFGYLFLLLAAGAALLLAVGSGLAAGLMTGRARAYELAILRSVGLSRGTLLRSLLGERLLVVLPGLGLGLVAGLVGSLAALGSIPVFGTTAGEPPPATAIPWGPVLLTALVLVVVLAASSVLSSLVALREARFQQLRGGLR